ncbi:MAG TPA: PilZ domain-containing protein [Solirubrobacteraceae bacterium]|nr:PilZ domain-containing protein [Solirubrobacteraceae bacterium]
MSQKREYVRLRSDRPVLVYMGKDRRQVQTYAVELSGGGLLLAGPHVLEIDEEVEFKLTLAQDREPIVGIGRVVRTDSRGRRAITFSQMSDGNRRRLVRFIFERERAERRRMLEADEHDGN